MDLSSTSHSSFARRLHACADRAGSAYKLAKAAGLHRNSLGKYLRGETEPTRRNLVKIARAAGVSVEWLVTGSSPPDDAPLNESGPELTDRLGERFYERLKQAVARTGGVEQLAELTRLTPQRIEQLLGRKEMSLSEFAGICAATNTPASWLLGASGFDHIDHDTAVTLMIELLTKIESVEASRSGGMQGFTRDVSAWEDGRLHGIFQLWEKIYIRLPPKYYTIHEVEDNLMAPELEPNDLAVVANENELSKPGIYFFQRGGVQFFARCVPAAGVYQFSFDNENYHKASANQQLLLDGETKYLGRVVAVFGPPR